MHKRIQLTSLLMGTAMMFSSNARADAPLYAEPLRPQFHFTSSTDWLNDPNGLVFYEGTYHLFFQRVPGSTDGNTATKSWGHATGTDLVHWKQVEDAISPDANGSIWSGSAVVDWHNTSGFGVGGKPPLVAFYTRQHDPDSDQRIAYSTDGGTTWMKYDGVAVPHMNGINRDPKVIWHEPSKQWVLALYLDRQHQFALFTSPNLKDWTKLQEVTLDDDNECPDFFPLALDGDASKTKWVFTAASARYIVGTFNGKAFTPQTDSLAVEHGQGFYAAQTFSDIPAKDGRRIQIGWMRDGRYPDMPFNQQMAFPCELTLRSTPRGPRLFKWPVKEIESLYGRMREWKETPLPPNQNAIEGLAGDCFDLEAQLDVGQAQQITLNVRGTPVTFTAEGKGGSLSAWDRRVALPDFAGTLKLRVLVDRTSIEIFAQDGEVVLSGCVLPKAEDQSITLAAEGGTATVKSLVAREVQSALPTK